jgi:hypothetical protein
MTKKLLHIQKGRGVGGRVLRRREQQQQQQQQEEGNSNNSKNNISVRRVFTNSMLLIVLCILLLRFDFKMSSSSYFTAAPMKTMQFSSFVIWNNDNETEVDTTATATATSVQQNVALATTNLTDLLGIQNLNYGPSQLAGDVEKIIHIPSKQQIVIYLKDDEQRNCTNPSFFGRLSGPYITAIQWEQESASSTSTLTSSSTSTSTSTTASTNRTMKMMPMPIKQITGYYSVPSPGRYFIEVISLLCNDLLWETNYKDVCLENPTSHRITNSTAFIDVVSTTAAAAEKIVVIPDDHQQQNNKKDLDLPLGHWKWSLPDAQEEPLFTRYQPLGCALQDVDTILRCQVPMSRARFSPYEFVYNNNNKNNIDNDNESNNEEDTSKKIIYNEENIRNKAQKILAEQQRQKEENGGKIILCFIGLSHAREMAREVNLWLSDEWNVSQAIAVKQIDAQFPRLVSFQRIKNSQCNKTVIAAGQWSAGRKPSGGKYARVQPTMFPEYQAEVAAMISQLQDNGIENFYMRSIHYNSFGDIKLTCPPTDWRSPPVIDRYNDIIQNLSSTMNVPYIDTNFIIQPMWDSAVDFCHYRLDKIAAAEALYMTGRLIFDY